MKKLGTCQTKTFFNLTFQKNLDEELNLLPSSDLDSDEDVTSIVSLDNDSAKTSENKNSRPVIRNQKRRKRRLKLTENRTSSSRPQIRPTTSDDKSAENESSSVERRKIFLPQIARGPSRRSFIKNDEKSEPETDETDQSKSRNNNVIQIEEENDLKSSKNENENEISNSSQSVSNGSSLKNLPVRQRGRPKKIKSETEQVAKDKSEVVEQKSFSVKNLVLDREVRIVLERCDKLVKYFPGKKMTRLPQRGKVDEEKESASHRQDQNGKPFITSEPQFSGEKRADRICPRLKRKLIQNEEEEVERELNGDEKEDGFSDLTDDLTVYPPKKRLKKNRTER